MVGSQPFGVPPDAAQKSGETRLGSLLSEKTEYIATNDQRMQQGVYADGKLWSALTTMVAVGDDPSPHAGIAYFVLDPSVSSDGAIRADVVKQGYLAVANADRHIDILDIGCAPQRREHGSDQIAKARRLAGAGIVDSRDRRRRQRPLHHIKHLIDIDEIALLLAGDYSAATVDEHGSIWIASEYIPLGHRTLLANWGTFVAQIIPGR